MWILWGLYLPLDHAALPLCWGRTSFSFLFQTAASLLSLGGYHHNQHCSWPWQLMVPRPKGKSPAMAAECLRLLSGLYPKSILRRKPLRRGKALGKFWSSSDWKHQLMRCSSFLRSMSHCCHLLLSLHYSLSGPGSSLDPTPLPCSQVPGPTIKARSLMGSIQPEVINKKGVTPVGPQQPGL